MKNAIDIIENAKTYFLLSKDHKDTGSKPVMVGGRIKLSFALQDIPQDMIIATSGNDKRCIILVDYSDEEVLILANKANRLVMEIKAKN